MSTGGSHIFEVSASQIINEDVLAAIGDESRLV